MYGERTSKTMSKAEIRDGKLTIPPSDEIREKLDLRDGEEVEAHVLKGAVVLRPASAGARERVGERIFSNIDQVQLRPGQAAMTAEQVEQMIVDEVKAVPRAQRDRRDDG